MKLLKTNQKLNIEAEYIAPCDDKSFRHYCNFIEYQVQSSDIPFRNLFKENKHMDRINEKGRYLILKPQIDLVKKKFIH